MAKSDIQMLIENTNNSMKERGFDLMTEAKEIMSDADAFSYYADCLSEGIDESVLDDFKLLMENSREEFLMESNTAASLNAFAPLQMTLLRSIYPRLLARKAVTNRTLETPAEQFGWLSTSITDPSGAVNNTINVDPTMLKGKSLDQTITIPAVARDMFANATVPVTRTPYATVDRFYGVVNTATVVAVDAGGINPMTITVQLGTNVNRVNTNLQGLFPDINGQIFDQFTATHTDGTVNNYTLIGKLDREACLIWLDAHAALTGSSVTSVDYVGRVSYETNNTILTIQNVYKKDIIEVHDGELISSSVPVTYLKDAKALFNVDSMAQIVSTLGTIFSQVTDLRILGDLYSFVDSDPARTLMYDTTPRTSLTRVEQNIEIIERINKAIAICDNLTQFNGNLSFAVLVNPVDAGIISSINITGGTFVGGVSRGGVVRNYAEMGIETANGIATILSSKLVNSGELLVVPMSDDPNEIVYGQFDYSRILLGSAQGYLNPETPQITNVAMMNRDTRKPFRTYGITKIVIQNNSL